MDEALEIVELFADGGLEGAVSWLLRLLGVVALVAGIGVWVFTDVTLIVPAALFVVGILLLVVPEILLTLVELVG